MQVWVASLELSSQLLVTMFSMRAHRCNLSNLLVEQTTSLQSELSTRWVSVLTVLLPLSWRPQFQMHPEHQLFPLQVLLLFLFNGANLLLVVHPLLTTLSMLLLVRPYRMEVSSSNKILVSFSLSL